MKMIVLGILMAFAVPVLSQNSVSTAFEKSYINEENEEYEAAIEDLMPIYNSTSYSINLRLGWLYYLNGSFNKSQSYYKNAVQLEENSVEALFGYVYPTAAMQNWDDVLNTYLKILEIDPNNTLANYRLAYIYFIRKRYSESETHLLKILQLYPFDYDTNLLLGNICVKLGKIKEAKDYFQSALEYSPTSEEVQELLKAL